MTSTRPITTINNLETETTHYFSVRSINEGGSSPFSSEVAFFIHKLPFDLNSNTFTSGGPIPESISLSRGNLSPELNWSYSPKESQSFAIVMDSESSNHWTQIVSGDTTSIAAGDAENYSGPNPPKGINETYYIKLYALDKHETAITLPKEHMSRDEFEQK